MVVFASAIEFAAELLYPDAVDVAVGILEIGRSSFRFAEVASQNQRVGAYAEFVMVTRNGATAAALPETWRAILERLKVQFAT
jgi:acyl-CoA thioesterase FadM